MAEQTENLPRVWDGHAWVPVIIPGPPPDWADLREMARNAGWAGHADEQHVRIWGANGTDRMNLDWDAGSVRVFRHGLVVDLAGPSATYAHEAVHLINPTPARVLAAARLIGLGGTS